jgi:signal transduction histidine kinase
LKNPLSQLRLRTRLALVMFITMAFTSAILFVTYVRQAERMKEYVSGITSDLLKIQEVTRPVSTVNADPKQILQAYTDGLKKAGLRVDAISPSGDVQASTDPHQLNKKLPIKRQAKVKETQTPPKFNATFPEIDVDPKSATTTFQVQFPVVDNNKVIGYMVLHGVADQVDDFMRRTYLLRSAGMLAAMLAGMFVVVYLGFLFTKPIDALVRAANRVAQGNLEVSLPVSGADEMARLAETFNHMVERLRENRQLQERLNEAERTSLLGRLAATMAHEVRNSLNTFTLSADQIRAKHGGGDDQAARELQRYVAIIKDEVARLNHLVNNVLAGRQEPPALAPCDLRVTLQEAVAMVEKQAHAQCIHISKALPDQWPILQADAAQIKTCFLNILTNAIQAMPLGGEIRISARTVSGNGSRPDAAARASGFFELRVADTGPGIPPEERERVFNPFFSTKTTGFGLGLAITRKIVEDHGGRIYVDAGSGPGTEMVVELPVPQGVGMKRDEAKVKS